MRKLFLACAVGLCMCSFSPATNYVRADVKPVDRGFPSLLPNKPVANTVARRYTDSAYDRIQLENYGLSKDVFYDGFKGYEYLMSKGMIDRPDILTIIDYSQSSTQKRLYVIDLRAGRVLYNTYVSHGKNSGGEFATSFSNVDNSNKSSLGFIITGSPYSGKSGYSLHLKGVEPGINDHIYQRSIVMHGSHYVNERRADESEVGRSFGCPAVPYGQQYSIINTIKGGSCVFIYAPDNRYKMGSRILNAVFQWPALKGQSPLPESLLQNGHQGF